MGPWPILLTPIADIDLQSVTCRSRHNIQGTRYSGWGLRTYCKCIYTIPIYTIIQSNGAYSREGNCSAPFFQQSRQRHCQAACKFTLPSVVKQHVGHAFSFTKVACEVTPNTRITSAPVTRKLQQSHTLSWQIQLENSRCAWAETH